MKKRGQLQKIEFKLPEKTRMNKTNKKIPGDKNSSSFLIFCTIPNDSWRQPIIHTHISIEYSDSKYSSRRNRREIRPHKTESEKRHQFQQKQNAHNLKNVTSSSVVCSSTKQPLDDENGTPTIWHRADISLKNQKGNIPFPVKLLFSKYNTYCLPKIHIMISKMQPISRHFLFSLQFRRNSRKMHDIFIIFHAFSIFHFRKFFGA